MWKFLLVILYMLGCCDSMTAQQCHLNASYDIKTSRVIFDWNMVNYLSKTTYILQRSDDDIKWIEIVTDKILRNYTEADIFDFDDKINPAQKYYYRLKIIDANKNPVAFSNPAIINAREDKNSWVIYPNPVNDILNLACRGNNTIRGVINVVVQNLTGKIVTRFRAASIYRNLQIPVSNLPKGIYVVQIFILNELVLNQKFSKQ